MHIIKQYKGQLFFTLILFLAILIMPFQDYTERTFLMDEMNYPEDAIGIVEKADGILTVPEGVGALTLESNSYYFKKGTYEVTFSVPTGTDGSSVEVYAPLHLNTDNTSGQVLASSALPADGTDVKLTFSVTEAADCIQFRIHSAGALEFHSIHLISERGLYCDPFIYAGLLLLASAILLFWRIRRRVHPEALLLLVFAAVWSSIPLFFPWLLKGHDMFFHYGRLFNLSIDLFETSFPVRIHSEMFHGFGYMSSIFYSEFFLYPFALLCRLGMSPIGCYKLLLTAINFAVAGVSYYAFSRLCRSRKIGLIASFLYTLSAYRLINLYTRSAVGEALATIFLPLLILGMYQLFLGDSRKWLTSVVAFTGLFQSHMITTELAIGFSILFALCNLRQLKDGKRLSRLLIAAGATVLLNLWFILPFLDHMRYSVAVLGDARNLAGYSLYAAQIFDTSFSNPAGEALGRGSISGEMSYSIGLILLIGSLLFLAVCFRKNQKRLHFQLKLGKWCLVLGVLSVYASSIYFPWERLQSIEPINRIAGNIQFASRFLPFATLFLCITSAVGIYGFFQSKEIRQMLFLLCAVFLTWSSGTFFGNFTNQAETFVSWEDQMDHAFDTDALYLISNDGEYFSVRKMYAQNVSFEASDGVTLTDCCREGSSAGFIYTKKAEEKDAYVDVSLNYYPYYHAYDSSGNRLETSLNDLLRLRIALPEASADTVTIRLELPGFYRLGDCISLLTTLFLIALTLVSGKKTADSRLSQEAEKEA